MKILLIYWTKVELSIRLDRPIIQTPVDDRYVGDVDLLQQVGEDCEVLEARCPYLQPVGAGGPVADDVVGHLASGCLGAGVDLSCRDAGLGAELEADRPGGELLQALADYLD